MPISVAVGLAIVIDELVEIAIIGYHWLQVFYIAVGLLIALLDARMWMGQRDAAQERDDTTPVHR